MPDGMQPPVVSVIVRWSAIADDLRDVVKQASYFGEVGYTFLDRPGAQADSPSHSRASGQALL